MAVDQDARDLVNSLLAAIATKPDLGSWAGPCGVPLDYSVMVRNEQPANSGNSQFMFEAVQLATTGAMIAKRPGACGIQSVELDDILSHNESQPGDPFTGSFWYQPSTSTLKQYDGSV